MPARILSWVLVLSAFRSIEKDPRRKVFCKVFEPVLDARRNEQHLTRLKRMPLSVVHEITRPGYHDIHFILRVRLLAIDTVWLINLYLERTMAKQSQKFLSIHLRKSLECT